MTTHASTSMSVLLQFHVSELLTNVLLHVMILYKQGSHQCSDVATCTNTSGSYTCECNDGWKGDGVTCENIGTYIGFKSGTH